MTGQSSAEMSVTVSGHSSCAVTGGHRTLPWTGITISANRESDVWILMCPSSGPTDSLSGDMDTENSMNGIGATR